MTFSIAAWDQSSSRLGAAISSSSIRVASSCPQRRAGVGLALSQNVTDPLALLAAGWAVYEPQIDARAPRARDPAVAPAFGVPGNPA